MRTHHVLHGEFSLASLFSLATEMTVDGSVILFTFSFTWGTGLLLEAWPGNSSLSCSLSSVAGVGTLVPCYASFMQR